MNVTDAPRGEAARTVWEHIGVLIVVIVVPLLLIALPIPPTKGKWAVHKQDWVLTAAIVTAVLSLAAHLLRSPLFPRRRSLLPLIVLGTSLLVIANVQWNKSFRHYADKHRDYRREVFRKAMVTSLHSPVYGRYDNAIARWDADHARYSFATLPWAIAATALAAAWYAWARTRKLEKRWCTRSLALLLSMQLALIILFAACEPWPTRFGLKISGYSEFKKDVTAFHGIADTLRNYVGSMKSLQWYGQHYPPGNLLLIELEKLIHVPGLTKSVVVLMAVLAALPLYGLARELDLDDVAANAALLLFTAGTGVLIYCTINTTPMLLFPGTLCLWMLVRGLKTGSVTAGVILGFSFAFYLFFSFSASILGVLMALTAALAWLSGAATTRNLVRTGAVSLATLLVAIGLLLLTTHFNLIACFIAAVHGHQQQQGNEGFDDAKRYLLRSTGNIIAYLLSIVPLCILAACAIATLWRDRKPSLSRAIFTAVAVTVVIAGFSGLFYVETERIWIFLTPVFALAGGFELARRSKDEGRGLIYAVLLLVLVISCTQEFLFMHYR